MIHWSDISITRRLYAVIGTMALLLGAELITLRFAMQTLSAVRAFVGGEGSWSKAQKNAAIALERYAVTHSETDYAAFENLLAVPAGDHRARVALMAPEVDLAEARAGFLAGKIHPQDIEPMIDLLQRFSWVSYLSRALHMWGQADSLLDELRDAASDFHELVRAGVTDEPHMTEAIKRIERLNGLLTEAEDQFSDALSEGSRWLDRVVITLLVIAVLTVESIGLSLTFLTARRLSQGLAAITDAAGRIGQGDFQQKVDIRSHDEIGAVGEAINQMGTLLERSYSDLEKRVQERTAELAALAAQNAALYERASRAVKMRDEFVSIASHELRSPLTVLQMRLHVLQRLLGAGTLSPESGKQALEIVGNCSRQAIRLSRLSSELLDLTHISLGKLEITREPMDLAAVVRDVASELAADATRAGSELTMDAAESIPGVWDATRIEQVVRNLLGNAIKYGEGKPIHIESGLDEARGVAWFSVRDRGPGIAPEHQSRIFERYERVESETRIAGLGLGLYVSREIVLAHGGTISVASAIGQGSTFRVELAPAVSAEDAGAVAAGQRGA